MTLEERLRAGETAEDLAAEFTQELNSAIAAINREKAIQDDAQLTADSQTHLVQKQVSNILTSMPSSFARS